jgi:hypothetical protein
MKRKNRSSKLKKNTPETLAFTVLISSLDSYVQAALVHGTPP